MDTAKSQCERLRELVFQCPRNFGKGRSTWTLQLLADVSFELGIIDRRVSPAAVQHALRRMGISWKRAKVWMTSPDPHYALKKARRDRLIQAAARHADWALAFLDEKWWNRLSRPRMGAWTAGKPLKMRPLRADDMDPDPIAICCYGALRMDTHRVMLRFVEGRPTGDLTVQFVEWLCEELRAEAKTRLIVLWDDASWHASAAFIAWRRQHNATVRQSGGTELIHFELPVGSPWLNNIEPCWTEARKAIVEPDRKLTAQETVERVCQHFQCPPLPYLTTSAVGP
jgi:transposase